MHPSHKIQNPPRGDELLDWTLEAFTMTKESKLNFSFHKTLYLTLVLEIFLVQSFHLIKYFFDTDKCDKLQPEILFRKKKKQHKKTKKTTQRTI